MLTGSADGRVVWYHNDGATPPNFSAQVLATDLGWVLGLLAGDLDCDGDLDVAATGYTTNTAYVLEHPGRAGVPFVLRAVAGGTGPTSVALADLNADEHPDVVLAWLDDNRISWLPAVPTGDACAPECRDGLDNDGDGLADFPLDGSCRGPNSPSETRRRCGAGFELVAVLLPLALARRRGRSHRCERR
ncbi:MAG: FG-GAP-like repeat-containing protein [Proteobacteria bacterium]|nr:FG-GAP-like repeat-containing protein [Pseudomonadota bacterium]